MGAGMGAHLHEVDGPAIAVRQIFHGRTGEILGHLLRRILVVAALNVGNLNLGIAGQVLFQQHGQIDDLHCFHSFSRLFNSCPI